MIDEVVEYWNRQPCNIRHGTAPIGSDLWSDQVTKRKYFVEPHIPAFAQFDRWTGKNVLEIGCGIGTDTLEFAKHGANITAIDFSNESAKLARLRTKKFFRAHVYCVNAEDWLPRAPWHGYDLIYSFGVLHHTPYPETVLNMAYDVLAPGGELRIMVYAKWSLKNLLREQPEAQAGCPIANVYSKREIRKMLEGCDYKVESIEKTHIFPWRIADYVEHRYVKRFAYRHMPQFVFNWLERRLGWHLLIVARKNETSSMRAGQGGQTALGHAT